MQGNRSLATANSPTSGRPSSRSICWRVFIEGRSSSHPQLTVRNKAQVWDFRRGRPLGPRPTRARTSTLVLAREPASVRRRGAPPRPEQVPRPHLQAVTRRGGAPPRREQARGGDVHALGRREGPPPRREQALAHRNSRRWSSRGTASSSRASARPPKFMPLLAARKRLLVARERPAEASARGPHTTA